MRLLLAIAVLAAASIVTTGCAFKVAGPCKSLTHSCQDNSCTLHVEDKCLGWLRRSLFGTCTGCVNGDCQNPITNLRNGASLASVSIGDCGSCGGSSCSGGCDSPSMSMPSFSLPSLPSFGSMVSAPAPDCGSCGGGGCSSCGPQSGQMSGAMNGVFTGQQSNCGGCAGQGCGQCQMGLPVMPSFGKMFSNMGLPAGVGACGAVGCGMGGISCPSCSGGAGAMMGGGCGKFGCGAGGKSCLSCKLKGGGGLGGRLGNGRFRGRMNNSPYNGQIPHTPGGMGGGMGMGGPGGTAPSYAYPYYTTRGPRDFLKDNPPTIGW